MNMGGPNAGGSNLGGGNVGVGMGGPPLAGGGGAGMALPSINNNYNTPAVNQHMAINPATTTHPAMIGSNSNSLSTSSKAYNSSWYQHQQHILVLTL